MKETKKQFKAQLTNEISKKYEGRIAELSARMDALRQKMHELENENFNIRKALKETCETCDMYYQWNKFIEQFICMDETTRQAAYAAFGKNKDYYTWLNPDDSVFGQRAMEILNAFKMCDRAW